MQFVVAFGIALLAVTVRGVVPEGSWDSGVLFELDEAISDEFNGPSLDLSKWDEHGLRDPNTNCPRWNGPPDRGLPPYSTFFPSTEHPTDPSQSVRLHKQEDGSLKLRIWEQPESFFADREYYCNATTFSCNHNAAIPCYQTDPYGNPRYVQAADGTQQYRGITHDKCKVSPFCLPHYSIVSGLASRPYRKYASTHLLSKAQMKYGYLETRAKLTESSAVVAVWMHDDDMTGDAYCRFRLTEGGTGVRYECPSLIRSRRWEEIDVLEQMNSEKFKYKYVPNIHAFSMNKGEFSDPDADDDASGEMGGGPILVHNDVYRAGNPPFDDVPPEDRVKNDYHWNPGPVATFNKTWAEGWRTVGMYWSPRMICFFVDGEVVRCVTNPLIHQPMNIDISHALNVQWAGQEPTSAELQDWVQLDYVRVWKVFTPDGGDPTIDSKLTTPTAWKWNNLYGKDMHGVFDRFPHNDDQTVEPMSETTASRSFSQSNSSSGADVFVDGVRQGRGRVITAPLVQKDGSRGPTLRWRTIPADRDFLKDPPGLSSKKGFKRIDKGGNRRFSKKAQRLNGLARRLLLADEDRSARVARGPNGLIVDKVKAGGRTISEHFDATRVLAGWASKDGEGNDDQQ